MGFARADVVLQDLGRMARTAELKRKGVTEAERTRAVRAGDIIRPRQGVYALRDAPVDAVHAAAHGGTIGCSAAGVLHGLWILDVPPEPTYGWVAQGRRA